MNVDDVDAGVGRALRACSRKASTATKLKALRELDEALFDDGKGIDDGGGGEERKARSLETLSAILKPWARTYEKLSSDGDAGVRREATMTHGSIARCSGKSFGKILRGTKVMPSWMKTMCDPNAEVANAARRAFEKTFSSDERRATAVAVAHAEIFDDLTECLKRKSPADMLFREGSEVEQFMRFERSVLTALGALAATCDRVSEIESADAEAAAQKFTDALDTLGYLRVQITSEFPSIRREAYATLLSVAKRAANRGNASAWRAALARCVPNIAAVAFALMSAEHDQGCVRNMWELILGVASAHPSAWDAIDVDKSFIPGLMKHFKRGSYGAASISALSLLPLLAYMPTGSLITRAEDGTPMGGLLAILDSVFVGWCALRDSAVRANEARATLPALREGVLYGILKLAPLTDHAEECASTVLLTRVVDRWMREFLVRGDGEALDLMCDAMHTLGGKPRAAAAVVEAWAKLGEITEDALSDPDRAECATAMYARLLASGKGGNSAQATAPFAKAVFAKALETPSRAESARLASMVANLGVDAFDGAKLLIEYCVTSPTPPGAGAIVAAVLKHDDSWWDDALRPEIVDETLVAETLVALAKADSTSMGKWKRNALDDLIRRCASRASTSASSVDVLVATAAAKENLVSAEATRDAIEALAADVHDAASRRALRAWIWPAPASAIVTDAWAAAVGAYFAEVLVESKTTTSAVIREADSDGDSEDDIEFVETTAGNVRREWNAIERDVKRGESLARGLRTAVVESIARAAAAMARAQIPDDSALLLRLWAQRTAHSLAVFNKDDSEVVACIVHEALEHAKDDMTFRWLDAIARVVGWRPLLLEMDDADKSRRLDFVTHAFLLDDDLNGAFTAIVCGEDSGSLRLSTLSALVERAFDDDDVEKATLACLRRIHELCPSWRDGDESHRALSSALSILGDDLTLHAPTLTRTLPWLLPSDMSGGAANAFVAKCVTKCVEGINDRRRPLDGAALALVAACFNRGDDTTRGSPHVVHSLSDTACAPLMEVFRALAKREAADAAAEAAAARFGGPGAPVTPCATTSGPRVHGEVGVAELTAAIIRRTAAELDARDWGAIVGRLGAWTSPRFDAAKQFAAGGRMVSDDWGSAMLAQAATLLSLIAALPIEISEPNGRYSGDVVPYTARGADAARLAKALASTDWPKERIEIAQSLFACVILAGAELCDIEEDGDVERRAGFESRCELESDMWRRVADASDCGASTSSALEAALYVDDWDDAPCETIPALYALLLAPDIDENLRRAAYGLLASDALLQSAVVGLDARVADVEKVEKALNASLAARDDAAQSLDDLGTPAESAGLREDLAKALERDVEADAPELLAWALLLRYMLALAFDSPCRERLVNYTRETKAIPRLLRALVRTMPLPRLENGAPASRVDVPSSWRDVDWNDPTASSQLFSPRLSIGILLYGAALHALPASVRAFVHDLKPPKTAKALESATAASVSSALIAAEFAAVSSASFASVGSGSGSMSVKANPSTGEVITRYEIDESCLELVVKLPSAYPLAQADLHCAQRVGISEQRLRKWMLGISSILTHQNGAVAQGLLQWQRNIDAEFAGVEPCPICYSVIHPVDHRKPSLRCRQCANTFHASCLYTWFRTGSRSICPLCQQSWGTSTRDS